MTTYRNGQPVQIPAKVISAYMANLKRKQRDSLYVVHHVLVQGKPTGFDLALPFDYAGRVLGRKANRWSKGNSKFVDFHDPLPASWFIDLNGGQLEDQPLEE